MGRMGATYSTLSREDGKKSGLRVFGDDWLLSGEQADTPQGYEWGREPRKGGVEGRGHVWLGSASLFLDEPAQDFRCLRVHPVWS